jgi:hypothetical protein
MNLPTPTANPEATLVVFCRRPARGVGKQRLAAAVGADTAHAIAAALLDCTLEDLAGWPGSIVLAPAEAGDADWARALLGARARVVPQPAGNLGARLESVDRTLRGQGLERLLFIGTDAPALPPGFFAAAAAALGHSDVVLGPARDGGVTLMGARRAWPPLAALPWSTATLGAALAAACRARGDAVALLEESADVDELADLDWLCEAIASDPRPARRAVLLLLAVVLALLLWRLPVAQLVRDALDWTAANREVAWIAFVALYVVATVCFVPGLPLTLAAGAIFGVAAGTALVSVGSTLGATAAFFVGRTVARRWVTHRIEGWPRFRAVDRAVAARGFWIVLLMRLSPVLPFFLLNYVFGVTAVKPREYVLGSWLGMLPATLAYVYAGSVAANLGQALAGKAEVGTAGWVLLAIGLVATVTVAVLVTRLARSYLERELGGGGAR